MLQLLERGQALYVLSAICLLGVITRVVTKHLYKGLLKESTNLAMTKNKSLKELRKRAENTYLVNQGMRDSGAWLDYQFYDLKAMGIRMTGWSNLCMQWTWLCLIGGGVGAFFSYWYRLDTSYIVLYGGGAVLMAMFTMLFDNGAVGGCRNQLLASLQNQLENVMGPKLMRNMPADGARSDGGTEQTGIRNVSRLTNRSVRSVRGVQSGSEAMESATGAETLNQGQRTAVERGNAGRKATMRGSRCGAQNDQTAAVVSGMEQTNMESSDYLKRSLEQLAASRERGRSTDENWLKDLKPEEVELIGDILKQYLA